MNLKLKALVVSLALTFAIPASAAMNDGSTAGDSSLMLILIDTSRSVSATFDLGVNKSTFNTSNSTSFDLTGVDYLTAWDTFKTGATWSNVQYSVIATDNSGSVSSAGSRSLFSTATGNISGVSTSQFATAMGSSNFDSWISATNSRPNHRDTPNGGSYSSLADSATSASYAGDAKALGSVGNRFAGLSYDTSGLVGSNMNVYNVLSGNSSGASVTSSILNVAGFNPYFSFDQTYGTLSYTAVAAVPEADSTSMIFAGIGLMAFIARRRKS